MIDRRAGLSAPLTVAFIGGVGRSGSTVLSRVLGGAPEICAVGEISHVWDQSLEAGRQCGCGELIRECPLWTKVGAVAFGGWERLDLEEMVRLRRAVLRIRLAPSMLWPVPRGPSVGQIERYRTALTKVYRAVSQVTGCPVVLDSSKNPAAAMLLRRSEEVDLKIIHLIRSSYGVSYSWTKHVTRVDRGEAPMHRISPMMTAVRWNAFNAAVELIAKTGTPSVRLCYEDFIADPGPRLRTLMSFLGLDPAAVDQLVDGRTVQLAADHSVAGNPMRFRVGAEPLRMDDEWRQMLPASSKAVVGTMTGLGMLRYGYRLSGSRRES